MGTNTIIIILLAVMLAGCGSVQHKNDQVSVKGDWLHTVIEYRQALNENPYSVERKLRLKQAELMAADFYYKKGMSFYKRGIYEVALTEFQKGLTAMPYNEKLSQALSITVARHEAAKLFIEAESLRVAGRLKDAKILYQKSLGIYPEHQGSLQKLMALKEALESKATSNRWAMDSDATITLSFRGTDLRTAFEFIAKSFKVNVIFDEGTKGVPVTMFASDVTFKQAISLLTATTKTFYKRIGTNTIIIASDKKDKRGQYEDHITRMFPLKSIRAKEMRDILKNILTIRKIAVNERLNTLMVRDTADILSLVEKVIINNDRKPAEMILDVEILEVSRTKADKLGLDLGTYEVSVGVPSATRIPLTGSIPNAISGAANLTLPSVTLRFLKQEIDAKTLANPRIRVVDREAANIHIGDRVPLQASRIIDATGQVRTTFDYRDIGIRLKMMPTINLDHTITVKLDLEVSSLGENLGTPNEPAFKIGTRNASTVMILRDGETAILGGLIRDEERTTESKLPFLGSIPFLGRLFTSSDKSGGRTDILLTISPRIIRGHDLPPKNEREFYSGTAKNYLNRAVFAYGSKALNQDGDSRNGLSEMFVPPAYIEDRHLPQMPNPATLMEREGKSEIGFAQAAYQIKTNEDVEIEIDASHLSIGEPLTIDLLYNANLLQYMSGESDIPGLTLEEGQNAGVIHLVMESEDQLDGILAKLLLRAKKPGVSYLAYRIAPGSGDIVGAVSTQSSKVIIE